MLQIFFWGGGQGKLDVRGGVGQKQMNADRGGEGVKKSENFADVICVWPLTVISDY